jgi:hypothetical protein
VAGADGDALALWDASHDGGRQVIALPLAEPSTPVVLGAGTIPSPRRRRTASRSRGPAAPATPRRSACARGRAADRIRERRR